MLGGMEASTPEVCAECGFDSRRWRRRDAASVFGELGFWWEHATAGIDPVLLGRRPAPGVWSTLEYGLHSAMVTAVIRAGLEMILADDGCRLPPPPATPPDTGPLALERGRVVGDLGREGAALARLAKSPDGWDHAGLLGRDGGGGGDRIGAEALLVHAAHDATHHFMDAARGLAAVGAAGAPLAGRLEQINVSAGGVPKTAVPTARVGHQGLEGDAQRDRKHHGRPFQAVCLWAREVIEGLAATGHPIAAGCAGENFTLSGVDWAAMRPGARLRVGTVTLEVSFPATPCHHQTRWFADGDFSRIDFDREPRATRWYAWVREPGDVAVGDPVTTPVC